MYIHYAYKKVRSLCDIAKWTRTDDQSPCKHNNNIVYEHAESHGAVRIIVVAVVRKGSWVKRPSERYYEYVVWQKVEIKKRKFFYKIIVDDVWGSKCCWMKMAIKSRGMCIESGFKNGWVDEEPADRPRFIEWILWHVII